jgi:hypothetical protein
MEPNEETQNRIERVFDIADRRMRMRTTVSLIRRLLFMMIPYDGDDDYRSDGVVVKNMVSVNEKGSVARAFSLGYSARRIWNGGGCS